MKTSSSSNDEHLPESTKKSIIYFTSFLRKTTRGIAGVGEDPTGGTGMAGEANALASKS
jgi:hypothetical protein